MNTFTIITSISIILSSTWTVAYYKTMDIWYAPFYVTDYKVHILTICGLTIYGLTIFYVLV